MSSFALALILARLFAQAASGGPQEAAPQPVLEQASPEARAAWEKLLDATRTDAGDRAPITSFSLKAEVLTRSGVQTNEMAVDYRYLAPSCIRFLLPSRLETGRFGERQREYWLKDGEEVVKLAGKDYAADRKLVDEMHAVATNFVALSDPARIRLTALEALDEAPSDLSRDARRQAKKLTWIRVASPDFALFTGVETKVGDQETTYVADLGLMPDGPARFAVIRTDPRAPRAAAIEPILIRMDKHTEQNGFRVPFQLFVYHRDPKLLPIAFGPYASQEIYVTAADLRAAQKVADFRP